MARQLISLVNDSDLPKTRLIITGFDPLGLVTDYPYQLEQIPPIDEALVRTFLATVPITSATAPPPMELADLVAEVVKAGGGRAPPAGGRGRAVVELARKHWARESGDGRW